MVYDLFKHLFMAKTALQDQTSGVPDYSTEAKQFIGEVYQEIVSDRNARESHHPEFDDMTYTEYNQSNFAADIGYIPPKENEQDVRLVAGIIPEKSDALASFLEQLNITIKIRPINSRSREELWQLGKEFEDLLIKARYDEKPNYEFKRALIRKEALRQGDAFVKNLMKEEWGVEKKFSKFPDFAGGKLSDKSWSEQIVLASRKLTTTLVPGINVYPGNIRSFWMEEQPHLTTKAVIPYPIAEGMFKNFPMWEYVQRDLSAFGSASEDYDVKFNNWSIGQLRENQVEVLFYERTKGLKGNVYAIFANGVLLTPVGFPLSSLTGKNRYSTVKYSTNPISEMFFYSKSVAAKNKTDEEVMSEFKKLMVLKTQQSFAPPLAILTGDKNLSEKCFWPAQLNVGIDPNNIKPLIPTLGVTTAEMAVYQLFEDGINKKSVSPVFQGAAAKGNPTATQIEREQQQSIQKIGGLVLSTIQFESELADLTLDNVKFHWTDEEDTRVDAITNQLTKEPHLFEIETSLESGVKGTKVIEFSDRELSDEQFQAEAMILSFKRDGKRIKKTIISKELMKKMDIAWQVTAEAQPKNTDALSAALAKENHAYFAQMFPGKLNEEYWLTTLARHAKVDKEQAFIDEEQAPPMMAPEGQGMTGQLAQMATPRSQRPTINSLAGKM